MQNMRGIGEELFVIELEVIKCVCVFQFSATWKVKTYWEQNSYKSELLSKLFKNFYKSVGQSTQQLSAATAVL